MGRALSRLIFIMVLAVGLTAATTSLMAAAFVGQSVKVRGDVRITRDGADMTCGMGTALQLGDVITTGPDARLRLRFIDGSILTLGEKSKMSIDIFSVDGTNNSRTVVLTMLEGIVNAAAAKSGESKFDYQIKTENAYSAVRGTQWIVSSLAGATAVYVLSGKVELGAGQGQPELIAAGNWGSVDAQGKLIPIAPTTPEMLQPLLTATSDTGGQAPMPAPGVTPEAPPLQTPSLPAPKPQRAYKNNNGDRPSGGRDTGGYHTN